MPARKRTRQELEPDASPAPARIKEPSLLVKLRNTWEFASLMQYIYIFGKVVKIDEDLDIDELEAECLKPTPSEKLSQIGLALLKYVSSHKGLTPEIFDEYTRRQFVAKAPQRNPFGTEEAPAKFNNFDIFTKLRVLWQLSTWTLGNADRIREKMPERDSEQTQWRIEPVGWDSEERTYFILDDDRLYRRTDAPLPPEPPRSKAKAKTRKGKATRGSKRRKLSVSPEDSTMENGEEHTADSTPEMDTFGGMKWECIAVTYEEYIAFLDSMHRSRDPDEKALVKSIQEDVMPIIQKRADEQRAKQLRKQRELENMAKLAHAKRSSRIAGRMEKQKEIEDAEAAERKRLADLEMARKEQEKQQSLEQARETRMLTRAERLKEREVNRILQEERIKKLEEDSKKVESNEARLSERKLKAEMEKRQKELERLAQQEDEWIFDCSVCGMHGENLDDGTHSVACEKCNVWQHSACHGIAQPDAERDDFHFVCKDCQRRATEPKLPPLKLHLGQGSPQKATARTSPLAAPPSALDIGPIPSTSFPPSSAVPPSFSPVKQASSPPQQYSPPSSQQQASSSQQHSDPTSLLPEATHGISPEKHDSIRPPSSQGISETPVLPPIAALPPSSNPPILTPPSKKMTPEKQIPDANGADSAH
ncbi:hypothetical protein K490DRAFT_38659 [Saccharata proteae CBS 121410]|uniref:Zinc finger PHD-type domain-containing protein n=1 Tax=Saccharata proteae CBS 121410 TaxID=1314787 RepID=A0A6A5YDA6_9PEZI|nr:hypothetical protein K490DRAFT_38659 [Saccharata proteae CBS 121410]